MKAITIGQVAKKAAVGVETVRFYEREGLLEEPARTPSGYRQFTPATVDRLVFIRRAKDLGFSLREIKDLLSLRVAPETNCAEVEKRARAKITDVEDRIRRLQRIKRTLKKLTEACASRGETNECPILEALDHEERQ